MYKEDQETQDKLKKNSKGMTIQRSFNVKDTREMSPHGLKSPYKNLIRTHLLEFAPDIQSDITHKRVS